VEMAFGEMDFAIGLWRNEELGFQRERERESGVEKRRESVCLVCSECESCGGGNLALNCYGPPADIWYAFSFHFQFTCLCVALHFHSKLMAPSLCFV
jgi:hypothetical protein